MLSKKSSDRTPRPRSRRPAINTYYRAEKKADLSPFVKKTPKKQVKRFLFGFLDIIILAVLLLALVYSLALNSNPMVDANDFSYHPKAAYAAAAKEEFGQLKNRNKLTFDESSVAKALEAKFPEITAAQVELPLFSERPVLHLVIAAPSFILNSGGSDLVIDSSGVAVAPITDLKVGAMPFVDDKSGFPAAPGKQVMSSNSVDFINTLLAQCRKANVSIVSLTLPAAPEELQLRAKGTSYFVKFYLGGDALQQTGQYLAARQRFARTGHPPAQYLDVRVSGKIFYK